ncbi:hypothetical protein GCM10009789_32300 [Kribbella sancticallisti]|uniref:Uncharacterized protein n=1 Tax=Kribbella sancticallisti TaxID=460087 RepID=A0ABN2DI71_9ACTN
MSSERAPADLRAQVFVTIASLKIGAASLAGAAAGLLGNGGGRDILLAAATAVGIAALAAVGTRSRGGQVPRDRVVEGAVRSRSCRGPG